jgi:hypothetical protein
MPPEPRPIALARSCVRFAAWQQEQSGGGSARLWWAVRRLQRLAELLGRFE